ncbi:chemotaxis response regulator protein-glutamate methylesterase [Simiduia sp. 21SJ11W-1]|uniref:protein-glutamate methylesterase/protein-glutamine glutaminase n=1 Tax=Simiduia sp. 21SJ11W-1 TaxID=2909669 RepID=UPI00209F2665|nr:chemotaxis response regulator protein-glutamate methylesterase [Simiduia sp. 21SJ11W-1]UTA47664.1 chemotaxis response regulator protein-glutamate methylesterase [Simiduia sp. 21SJ11W-1]
MTETKIKVLIVDDSRLVRDILRSIFLMDKSMEVVGSAVDPIDAREKIKSLNPDVITLDIEMPKMDGLTFLRNLMRLRPTPVVMISTLTEKGADATLQALELGAIDFIAKPKIKIESEFPALADEILRKVRCAARAKVAPFQPPEKPSAPVAVTAGGLACDLLAIGASTGGTEAIKTVLLALPANVPPIVIVQHMPPGFTQSFANRLNELLPFDVIEFSGRNEPLKPGVVYLANGAEHMIVETHRGLLTASVDDGAPVNRHKPSVDVLFRSVAKLPELRTIGVILTGMGMDGAKGLLDMRQAGAHTIAQDKESSVVWGMPRIASEIGAAELVLPLNKIGTAIGNRLFASRRGEAL